MSVPERPPLLVLHGSMAASTSMSTFAAALPENVATFVPDLLAHGGRPLPDLLTMDSLARDVIARLDEEGLSRTFVFGFSLGGTLALYLARHYPQRFAGVSTLAAKYVFDKRTIAHWTYVCSTDWIVKQGEEIVKRVTLRHAPQDWREVAALNRRFFEHLGRNPPLSDDDLSAIRCPALLFASNEDQIVPFDESVALGKLLPNSRTVLFRGQCHPIDVVPLGPMAKAIANWMDEVSRTAASA